MCDLTQFVVSNITTETHAEHIAKILMENVVLSFGMAVILVVDTNSRFKRVFKDMCTALGIIYWPLARGNHKGTIVEKYNCFLIKKQAISGQDRGTYDVILQNAKTSKYVWNSSPINGTDILRIIADVGG